MCSYWEELKAMNISFDSVMYNTMINGLGQRRELLPYMVKIFEEMKANKVPVKMVTFSSMVNAFGKHGDLENMKKYFAMLKQCDGM